MEAPTHRRRRRAGAGVFLGMLVATAVLLAVGLCIPAFTNDRLGQGELSYSILGSALELGAVGSYGLMVLIVLFSAVFPAAKLLAMFVLWRFDFPSGTEKRGLRWLEMLGKWSMLDVFVVATVAGASHLKLLNETTIDSGIYVFGLAIVLSLAISVWLRRRLDVEVELQLHDRSPARRAAAIALSLLCLALFVPGVILPLLRIEKWVFWDREYSLVTALPEMIRQGEWLLPGMILVFVVVLPVLRFAAFTAVRAPRRPGRRTIELAYGLEKWTMWEVYALALLVVSLKLGDFVELEFRSGFWCLLAVAPLAMLDGWLFERDILFRHPEDGRSGPGAPEPGPGA